MTSSLEQVGFLQGHTYFNNGIAESALLLIRKTTEFFKPKGDRDPPDTLYAYRYLDGWPGTWVIPKDIYIELHKRVGHITFSSVAKSSLFNGSPPKDKLDGFVSSLREVSGACQL